MDKTVNLQTQIDQTKEYGTLDLDFDEYQEAIVLSKPIVINGNNSTICSLEGPVVTISSRDVVLKNLRVEVTGDNNGENSDQNMAILAQQPAKSLENVIVKGNVKGVVNEDGVWQYPDVLELRPVVPGQTNYFEFTMTVPVSCALETDVEGLTIENAGLVAGENRVLLEVSDLRDDTILFGYIKIRSTYLARLIGISGGSFGSTAKGVPDKHKPISLDPVKKAAKTASPVSDSKNKASRPVLPFIIAALVLAVIGGYFLLSGPDKQMKPAPKDPVVITDADIEKQQEEKNKTQLVREKQLAAEKKKEAQRIAAEKKKEEERKKRVAREKRIAAEKKKEQARIEEEKQRIEKEYKQRQEELEKIAREKRLKEEQAEQARIKEEKRIAEAAKLKKGQEDKQREQEAAAKTEQLRQEQAKIDAQKEKERLIQEKKSAIDSKLAQAAGYIKAGRFVSPKSKNAFEIYEQMIAGESAYEKQEGLKGLKKLSAIGDYYVKENELGTAAKIFARLKTSTDPTIRERASHFKPISKESYLSQAATLKAQGQCDQAKSILEKAMVTFPGDPAVQQAMDDMKDQVGVLNIYSDPWAHIIIDGVDIARTSPTNNIHLSCGTHVIKLVNPDDVKYKERQTEIMINSGKAFKLIFIKDKVTKLEQ